MADPAIPFPPQLACGISGPWGMPPLCPVSTLVPRSYYADCPEEPEARAYKLGKRRWSYNEVELVLRQAGTGRTLTVGQAVNQGTESFNDQCRESAVNYRVDLVNGESVNLHGFLCYDVRPHGRLPPPPSGSQGQYQRWYLVQRSACCKGCTGPVIRVIQRFGKIGKRSREGTLPSSPPDQSRLRAGGSVRASGHLKDPRYLYLSFDEAGTHVGAKTFRLIVAVYDATGRRLLATASSVPLRVLANNDVPTGAAHIRLEVEIPADWEGWSTPMPLASPGARTGRQAAEDAEAAHGGDGSPPPDGATLRGPVSGLAEAAGLARRGWASFGATGAPPSPRPVPRLNLGRSAADEALAWAEGLAAHYPGSAEAAPHAGDGDDMLLLSGTHGGYGGRLLRHGEVDDAAHQHAPEAGARDAAGLRRQLEALEYGGDGGHGALAQAVLASRGPASTDDRDGAEQLRMLLAGLGAVPAKAAPHPGGRGGGGREAVRGGAGLSDAAWWSLALGGGSDGGSAAHEPGVGAAADELTTLATAMLRDMGQGDEPAGGARDGGVTPPEVTQALHYLQRVVSSGAAGGAGGGGGLLSGSFSDMGVEQASAGAETLDNAVAALLPVVSTRLGGRQSPPGSGTESPAAARQSAAEHAPEGRILSISEPVDEGGAPLSMFAPWSSASAGGHGSGAHEVVSHMLERGIADVFASDSPRGGGAFHHTLELGAPRAFQYL